MNVAPEISSSPLLSSTLWHCLKLLVILVTVLYLPFKNFWFIPTYSSSPPRLLLLMCLNGPTISDLPIGRFMSTVDRVHLCTPPPPFHWPRATLPYLLTLFQVHAALQLCLSECGGWGGGVAPPTPHYICKMSDTTNFVFGITTAFLANVFLPQIDKWEWMKVPACLSICLPYNRWHAEIFGVFVNLGKLEQNNSVSHVQLFLLKEETKVHRGISLWIWLTESAPASAWVSSLFVFCFVFFSLPKVNESCKLYETARTVAAQSSLTSSLFRYPFAVFYFIVAVTACCHPPPFPPPRPHCVAWRGSFIPWWQIQWWHWHRWSDALSLDSPVLVPLFMVE